MYKIGNLYIKPNIHNEQFLKTHYQLSTTLSDTDYEHQFQPFYYSEDFNVYKDYNDGATPSAALLLVHNTIYDEIKEELGIHKETIYRDYSEEKEIEPFNTEEEAYIGCPNASYVLNFYDNNFKSQDDYIINSKSLPKTVIDYLDLECKSVYYNWDGNDPEFNLYNQFDENIVNYINIENFDKSERYITSLNDFWEHIDNIAYVDINIDVDKECEIIKDRLIKIYKENENEDICIYEFIKNNIDELLQLDNITLLAVLVNIFNIPIYKYYFDLEKRLKQLENVHIESKYKNTRKTELYPEYEISEDINYDTLINTSEDINYLYQSKTLLVDYRVDCNNWGALVCKINNNYVYEEFVIDYIFNSKYYCEEFKPCVNKFYWFSFSSDDSIINRFHKIIKSNIDAEYVYCPNNEFKFINNDESETQHYIPKIFLYTISTYYYNPNGENIVEGYTINKYLPDIITKSSNIFNEFLKEYTKDEVYNVDLRDNLKSFDKSERPISSKNLNLPKDSKEMGLIIHHLISYIQCNLIDDYLISIVSNLFYLQMFDILDLIEIITRKHIFDIIQMII